MSIKSLYEWAVTLHFIRSWTRRICSEDLHLDIDRFANTVLKWRDAAFQLRTCILNSGVHCGGCNRRRRTHPKIVGLCNWEIELGCGWDTLFYCWLQTYIRYVSRPGLWFGIDTLFCRPVLWYRQIQSSFIYCSVVVKGLKKPMLCRLDRENYWYERVMSGFSFAQYVLETLYACIVCSCYWIFKMYMSWSLEFGCKDPSYTNLLHASVCYHFDRLFPLFCWLNL